MKIVHIVGAGRSGTTLLYKLLCLHPDIVYLSRYNIVFPSIPYFSLINRILKNNLILKRNKWFEDDGNAYFLAQTFIDRLIPMPREGENFYNFCGLKLYGNEYSKQEIDNAQKKFREIIKKYMKMAGGNVFLTKRTANNRRLDILAQITPEAKYIHVVRDGRDVTNSLLNVAWWPTHTLWWSRKRPSDYPQDINTQIELAARTWVEAEKQVSTHFKNISAEKIYNLRYEELVTNPLTEILKIYSFMNLEVPQALPKVISSIRMKSVRNNWKNVFTSEQIERIENIQGELLKRNQYV
ncbi:hypothetical protein PN36_04350 [Candidatus Thiomargarita nelsonii]|uniref:Sulfotransferase n=1 Tax=Candidatus Thiomargarita nelsonii TaxID=1003181 RepID=A0A0A6P490_9GAMM|nr:hypothetical protein PN36_04350 [Candidatus Thiomargarita nelsonii]